MMQFSSCLSPRTLANILCIYNVISVTSGKLRSLGYIGCGILDKVCSISNYYAIFILYIFIFTITQTTYTLLLILLIYTYTIETVKVLIHSCILAAVSKSLDGVCCFFLGYWGLVTDNSVVLNLANSSLGVLMYVKNAPLV